MLLPLSTKGGIACHKRIPRGPSSPSSTCVKSTISQNKSQLVPVVARNITTTTKNTEQIRISSKLLKNSATIRVNMKNKAGRIVSTSTEAIGPSQLSKSRNTCKQPFVSISKSDFVGDNIIEVSNLSEDVYQ